MNRRIPDEMMPTVTKTLWDCRQARTELALKAGGDEVDPAHADLLESHLAECAGCRAYFVQMTDCLSKLQSVAAESLPAARRSSLWPGIASRLPVSVRSTARARFNLWVPTAAMAVACAAMVMVTIVQIERVAPFQPVVTPRLQTVIYGPPQNKFERPGFPAVRPGHWNPPPAAHAIPVIYPARDAFPPSDF